MCSLVSRTIDAIGSITWQGDIGSITWQSCHIMGKWTPQDAAVALLDFGGLPGGVEVMQRHEALLDVRALGIDLPRERADGDNPRVVREKLEAFLPLALRGEDAAVEEVAASAEAPVKAAA